MYDHEHQAAYGAATQLPAAIAAHLRGERIACAGCRQAIIPGVSLGTRGGRAYHPSCACRHDAAQRAAHHVHDSRAQDRVIAVLVGAALSYDKAGCFVTDRNGVSDHEAFQFGCFRESIQCGWQKLCVNHSGSLRGKFDRIWDDHNKLRFRFTLQDGVREHSVLDRITSGAIRGCSIGFTPDLRTRDWRHVLHTRARLTEISLCDGRWPQWYDTFVEIAR